MCVCVHARAGDRWGWGWELSWLRPMQIHTVRLVIIKFDTNFPRFCACGRNYQSDIRGLSALGARWFDLM